MVAKMGTVSTITVCNFCVCLLVRAMTVCMYGLTVPNNNAATNNVGELERAPTRDDSGRLVYIYNILYLYYIIRI